MSGIDIEFEDDFSIVISAIDNGDIEDAVQMLREIREEYMQVIKADNILN